MIILQPFLWSGRMERLGFKDPTGSAHSGHCTCRGNPRGPGEEFISEHVSGDQSTYGLSCSPEVPVDRDSMKPPRCKVIVAQGFIAGVRKWWGRVFTLCLLPLPPTGGPPGPPLASHFHSCLTGCLLLSNSVTRVTENHITPLLKALQSLLAMVHKAWPNF